MQTHTIQTPKKQSWLKFQPLVLILASLLILMWIYTISNKLFELPKFKYTMSQQPLPAWLTQLLTYVLLPVEMLSVPLLYFTRTRIKGFILSFILMFSFTVYVAWMLVFHEHLPCACGGPIPTWGWRAHLGFNIFFTAIALWGIIQTDNKLPIGP